MDSKLLLSGSLVALLLAGCSGDDPWKDKRPPVVPAEGVVMMDGQPVEGASVVFAPAGEGYAASAVTDSSGRFVLQAFPPDNGAVAGSYSVGISKTVEILAEGATTPVMNPDDAAHAAESDTSGKNVLGWKNVLPENYANPVKSGLTASIPESGVDDLKFELTSSGG